VAEVRTLGTDPDAFERFYLAHFDDVLRFITRRVGDANTAADLTAEVFLAALGSAATYRGDGPAGAWLTGIARRVVSGEYRRSALRRDAERRLVGHRLLDDDDIACLEERIDAERRSRAVYGRIRRLPAGERAVLELVAVDGLSVREAAAVLGIRPVAARVRLHRARKTLGAAADHNDTPTVTVEPSLEARP
jgi:RNA polymerase sigma factor (sigma-70 family)